MTRPLVVLFDIDGTLLSTGGAGRRAMERAAAAAGLAATADMAFPFAGMTDPAIWRLGLERSGMTPTPAEMDAGMERYLAFLAEELPRSPGFRVMPGVEMTLALLDGWVAASAPVAVGLGTGNVVRGAELKLRQAGLWERFGFGGFGSDHEVRAQLIEVGLMRGAARLGVDRRTIRGVVIGDTPADVAAAQACGVECLAVATGIVDLPTLAATGAELTLGSLDSAEVAGFLRAGL